MIKRYLIIFSLICFGVMVAQSAAAAFPSLVPVGCQGDANIADCNLSTVEMMFTDVAKIILGLTGSISLAVFVYGGILFMVSSGNPANVAKATKVLRTATIGLALVILAGSAIKILLKVLGGV